MRSCPTPRTAGLYGYREWLSTLTPDLFATFTFAEEASDYRADRSARVFFRRFHENFAPSSMIYVVEPHPGNPEAHHLHALLKYSTLVPPDYATVRRLWRWGHCWIVPANGKAGRYVGKYMAKTICEWDILGDVSLWRISEPLTTLPTSTIIHTGDPGG